MDQPLLEIKGLDVRFQTEDGLFHALKNVSLNVQRGRITAVVGESGSGKSVTALSVLQLLAPNAEYAGGEIIFHQHNDSIDLLKQPEGLLRRLRGNSISMIFQEPMTSLNPLMRSGEQVAEAIMLHKKCDRRTAKEQTIALFQKVQLPDPTGMYKRYPHQLSGGQKQRVMIAMAMSCGPDLLIADEPTTALDVTVQKTILELIRTLQQETNMGVIFITHDLGLVAEIADDVVVMYKGEVVERGKVSNVLRQPSHPYTKALIACRPILHPKGSRLPTVADFIGDQTAAVKPASQPAPTPPTMNLMQVRGLQVWFPSAKNILGKTTEYVKAVDDVSFNVRQGETLGLVGESGCGKTTLGRALLRLVEPKSGEIIYRGQNLASWNKQQLKQLRKDIQIIFQDPYSSLNPRIPVGAAIAEVMKVHSIGEGERGRTEIAIEWLEKVGLKADHYKRYPHEFSGGQRQRIGIARALALDPGFVVCDESVSALDVSVQAQILNLLNDLKREMGFTTVFISHDLGVVHYISDRIMVMNKGQIEEIGEAEQVFRQPGTAYTQRLVDAIPGRNFIGS
ncbi:MAG: ABC transporter ATP-binding protein [Chitinophagaceae bacterium]